MIVTLNKTNAVKLITLHRPVKIHLQVYGPNTARLASDRETLEYYPGGTAQGLSLISADGAKELTWNGPLWAIGSDDGTQLDLELVRF